MPRPLLGIGRGERAGRLRDEGASAVVPDFLETEAVLELLLECGVPRRSR